MISKINCAILGCTGIVGQRFIKLLENHPNFKTTFIIASDSRVGKKYGETVHWLIGGNIPDDIRNLEINRYDLQNFIEKDIRIVFSAMPPDIAGSIEKELADNGIAVFSNSRDHRYDEDVPILIPEVNPDHIKIVKKQLKRRKGFIITNANCSTTGFVMALKPLLKYDIKNIYVSTYQALSGAGYPGVSSVDILGNVIPYIPNEEEKIVKETNKILGFYQDKKIRNNNLDIFSSCVRVPVKDGHLESVVIEFNKEFSIEEIKKCFNDFKSDSTLHTSPDDPIILCEDLYHPQPSLDVYSGKPERSKGMSVSIGRLKKQGKKLRFFLLVHNTIRGAAGNSILNAEYAIQQGYIKQNGGKKKI